MRNSSYLSPAASLLALTYFGGVARRSAGLTPFVCDALTHRACAGTDVLSRASALCGVRWAPLTGQHEATDVDARVSLETLNAAHAASECRAARAAAVARFAGEPTRRAGSSRLEPPSNPEKVGFRWSMWLSSRVARSSRRSVVTYVARSSCRSVVASVGLVASLGRRVARSLVERRARSVVSSLGRRHVARSSSCLLYTSPSPRDRG